MQLKTKAILAGVSLISISAPAYAQDDTESNSNVILVEARRRTENVQDVPQVVNALTSETIEQLNIRDVREIVSVVPGLSLTSNANGIGSSSSMRGVNHDVNVSAENGTIQYYVNDAPVASNLVLQTMFDISQITVERGPQGTLRGRSTPSGAINVVWRRPDLDEIGASVSGSIGSGGVRNGNFGVGIPIIRDMLAVRVAGLYDEGRGNRVNSVNSSIEPSTTTEAIRASARFEPFEFLKTGIVYQSMSYQATQFDQVQSMSEAQAGFTLPATDQTLSASIFPFGAPALGVSPAGNYGTISLGDRQAVQITPRTVETDFEYFGWNAEAALAGQRLIYVGSHLSTTFHPVTNLDPGAGFPTQQLIQDLTTTSVSETHEIRLQNEDRIAGIFDYVIGYFNQSASSETQLTSGSIIEGYAPTLAGQGNLQLQKVATILNNTNIYVAPNDSGEKSFFANVVAHIGDATELSGGIRRINFVNDSGGLHIGCTLAQFTAGTCTVSPGTNNDYDVNKTVYNVALRHNITNDLMVYVASGSSARPPVRAIGDFSTQYSPLEIAHTGFGAETSTSYEAGIKSEWLDNRLRLNATYYHQDFKNYPFRSAGTGVYYVNINSQGAPTRSNFNFISAVPVNVDGFEAELAYSPTDRFNFSTSLNWSKSSLGEGSMIACTDVNGDGVPDTAVPTLAQLQAAYGTEHLAECPGSGSATFLPEWSGTALAEYNLPVSSSVDLYLRGLLSWRGSTDNDPQNPYDDVGFYGLVNLYAGVRSSDGDWELGLYAKNLTDITQLTAGEGAATTNSTTLLRVAPGNPLVFGSQTYSSYYRGVSTNVPREIGVTFRVALGSR